MKKLAIGCLIVLVGGGAILTGVGYYAYTKVRSTVSQLAQLAQVGEIERGVQVRTAFAPPASGELTTRQVDQLMQILTRVHDRLGANMAAFERNYKALAEKKDATVVDLPALLSAYRDVAAAWIDAKKTQVAALNEAGLSLSEYRWIRSQAYRALDVPFFAVDVSRLADQAASGKPPTEAPLETVAAGPGADANRKLVEPHRKQLEQYVPLASFGL